LARHGMQLAGELLGAIDPFEPAHEVLVP